MFLSISPVRGAAAAVALLFAVGAATAQTTRTTSAGLKGGISLAEQEMSGSGIDVSLDHRLGAVGGVFIAIDPVERFGLQIEGLYSQKGFKAEDVLEAGTYEVRMHYVEVPILARINAPVGTGATFHVFGGATPAALLSDSQTFDGEDLDDAERDDYKTFDLGLTVGAGLTIRRVVIDARYTHGMLDVLKDSTFDDADDGDDDFTVKNRAFAIMVGFRF
jgi:hypothetical protein